MPQTQADLVRQTLKSVLKKRPILATTSEGRSELAQDVAYVLQQTCQVQHWFGPQHKGAEQDLLLALTSAQPEDALPSPLESGQHLPACQDGLGSSNHASFNAPRPVVQGARQLHLYKAKLSRALQMLPKLHQHPSARAKAGPQDGAATECCAGHKASLSHLKPHPDRRCG